MRPEHDPYPWKLHDNDDDDEDDDDDELRLLIYLKMIQFCSLPVTSVRGAINNSI